MRSVVDPSFRAGQRKMESVEIKSCMPNSEQNHNRKRLHTVLSAYNRCPKALEGVAFSAIRIAGISTHITSTRARERKGQLPRIPILTITQGRVLELGPERNHPSRLKSTVESLRGSVFRVRDPEVPNSHVLVDVEKEYCSCSLESNPDDRHLKIAKEYSKLKKKRGTEECSIERS